MSSSSDDSAGDFPFGIVLPTGHFLLAPADAPAYPQWTLLARVWTVQTLLADAPFVALGLVGFGLGTFWLVVSGLRRVELCLILSTLFAFSAAVFDLSQVLIVKASNRSPAPLVLTQQALLALSTLGRYTFLFLLVGRCPPREAALRSSARTTESKPPRSGFDEDDDVMNGRHAGNWAACGGRAFGEVIKWAAGLMVLAVGALSFVWRIGILFTFSAFLPFYRADLVLELVLSLILAVKLLITARVCARRLGIGGLKVLCDYAGAFVGLAIGMSVAAVGLVIAFFSETPVGRLLQALDLYVLSIAQLVLFFRAKPSFSVSYPSSSPLGPSSRRQPPPSFQLPRFPSPARRASANMAQWLRDVPHLLSSSTSPPATSSVSVGRGRDRALYGGGGGGHVELVGGDFRAPRSALGKDLGWPLTAGLLGRAGVQERGMIRASDGGGSGSGGVLDRPAAPHLASNGTFRTLLPTLGVMHVTNGSADDLSRSSAYSASTDSNGQALHDIGQLLSPGPPPSSRPRLPRLPSVGALATSGGRRTSAENVELLIRGGASPSQGLNLTLAPLATVFHPPPPPPPSPAAYTTSGNRRESSYVQSDMQTASARNSRTHSAYSQDSAPSRFSGDSAARRALPSASPPRFARAGARKYGDVPPPPMLLRRSSTRASSGSARSLSTSHGIASMYLDSFPVPPPPGSTTAGEGAYEEQSPTPARIGLALGGPDTDPRMSALWDVERWGAGQMQTPQPLRWPVARGTPEAACSVNLQGLHDDDVDVTSFIANYGGSTRDSGQSLTPRRFGASALSTVPLASPRSPPATIHRAQLLTRKPSVKVSTARSTPLAEVTPPCASPERLRSPNSTAHPYLTPLSTSSLRAASSSTVELLPLDPNPLLCLPPRPDLAAQAYYNPSLFRPGSFKSRDAGKDKLAPAPLSFAPMRSYRQQKLPARAL